MVFAGIALFSILALVGYLYLTPKQQPCANGALAKNPESQPGVVLPREDTMDSVQDAERFLCHSLAYPRDPSLQLVKLTAFRQSDLKDVIEATAYAEARFTYLHKPSDKTLQLNVAPYDFGPPPSGPNTETIRISGQEAIETHGGPSPDFVLVDWVNNGLAFHATTQLSGAMTQSTLVALLESIK